MQMKSICKKIAAIGLSAALAVNLSACYSDNKLWAAKYGDISLNTGTYIYYMQGSYAEAQGKVGTENKVLDAEIEGQKGNAWIEDETKKSAQRYFFVNQMFEDMGLTLTEEETAEMAENTDFMWSYYGASFEADGISKESMEKGYSEYAMKFNKIMQAMYGEGGEREISDEEIIKYYEDTYVSYESVSIPSIQLAAAEETAESEAAEGEEGSAAAPVTEPLSDDDFMERRLALEAYRGDLEDGKVTLDEIGEAFTAEHEDLADYVSVPGQKTVKIEEAATEVEKAVLELKDGEVSAAIESGETFVLARRLPIADVSAETLADEELKLDIIYEMKIEEFREYVNEEALKVEGIQYNQSALNANKISKYVTEDNVLGTSSVVSEESSAAEETASGAGEESTSEASEESVSEASVSEAEESGSSAAG